MIEFKTFWKIRSEAIQSIRKDSDGDIITGLKTNLSFYFFWYVIPISGVVIVFYKNLILSELQNYIGTSIAIFTGLFFTLLLGLGDKLRKEKANTNIDNNNYFRFKENMQQISRITQFIILIGVIIFFIILLNSLLKDLLGQFAETVFTSIIVYFLIQYFICIYFLLQRFHYTMKDELNNTI